MKKIYTLAFILLYAANLSTAQAQTETAPSGSGTAGDPHLISSLNNLAWLQDPNNDSAWNDYYKQTANIDASPTSTWNSGLGFSPIGDSASSGFQGTYDGQGFVINGLYISATHDDQGMFGHLEGPAVVKNLGLTNVSVSAYDFVGAVVGFLNSTSASVTNCYSTGKVSASYGDCG